LLAKNVKGLIIGVARTRKKWSAK